MLGPSRLSPKRHLPEITEVQPCAIFEAAVKAAKKGVNVPQAALTADKVATEAEFFSFGTNNPFAVLDSGRCRHVGKVVKVAVELGRSTNRHEMNYVSCFPYRVPIARLAAAQAAIAGDKSETQRTA